MLFIIGIVLCLIFWPIGILVLIALGIAGSHKDIKMSKKELRKIRKKLK